MECRVSSSVWVDSPCVSSLRLHRAASWQSQCQWEGCRWVAAILRHPSLDTLHSVVYSATYIQVHEHAYESIHTIAITMYVYCKLNDHISFFKGKNKQMWHQMEASTPTVMLLYSSSNISRKISSPCDDMINSELQMSHCLCKIKKSHFFVIQITAISWHGSSTYSYYHNGSAHIYSFSII